MRVMKLQLTLSQRLVVLMGTALIPLLGLSIINAQLNADAAVSRATKNLEFSSALVAASQARVIDSAHQLLASFSNSQMLINGDAAECQRYLATLKEQLGTYTNLGIVKLDGYVRCHALGGQPSNVFVGDRSYVQAALAKRQFVMGGYTLARLSGKPIISFTLPLMDAGGRLVALAFASMNLDELGTAISVASLSKGSQIAIMDRAGVVLTTNPRNPALVGKPIASPLLQNAARDMRTGAGDGTDAAGAQRIVAFLPTHVSPDAAFFVAVSVDKDEVLAPVRKQFRLELLVLALMALLGGCFSWVIGGRTIVRPTAAILDATRQLQQGRLDVRIPAHSVRSSRELAQIATSFNLMAESLQAQQGVLAAELMHSQAAQGKLLDVQRLARIGYWQIEPETQLITLSDEIYEMFQVDRADFDGSYEDFFKWIHPSDRETFKAARNAAIQTGASFEIEFRLVTPPGDVRWVHQFARVHYGADGKPVVGRTGVIQDITERKNAELAVIRSTDLLNRTGALAKVGGWELFVDTMTRYWSEEAYRIHDLDPLAGMNFGNPLDFYTVEAQPVIHAAVRVAIESATPWDLELPLVTATGRHIWVRTQGRALLEDGKVVRLVGVLQDVTVQHEAQANLRLLEDCFGHINDMVMIMDARAIGPSGPRIIFVNKSLVRHTGYSFEELVGSFPLILHGPRTDGPELERIRAAFKKDKPVQGQLIHYTKSGQELWVDSDISPILDASGKVSHWVAVERDVTQRRLAEQALIDSEQRYAALFETAPVPMWVYDIASTRFLAVNHAAVEAYGFSAAEFLSMTLFDVRPEAEHDYLRQFLANPERKQGTWHDRRKDGSLFAVETVSQPIQYDGHEARFVVVLDKTTQEKAEKDVQDYLFTLQRAADAAQAITWHQTLEGTMQEIVEQARGVIGAHQGVVSLSGEASHVQAIHALSLSEKYASFRQFAEPSNGLGIYAMVCENNRLIRLTQAELEAHPRWKGFGAHADRHPPMRGWLGVPLIGRNGKNIGLLQLSDKYEGEFTKQDEYVALELAHLASTAIENSRLLEEISQLNAGLEQKVIERTVALARQEALFRALAEQAPQTVWTANQDGGATYFNRAWFDLMGGEFKDWSGYQWFSAIHPEDLADLKANWKISRESQSAYAGIRRLRARDGSFHTMAYRASPVFDNQGQVAFWVGIDADITEIKNIEAALRLSNQELEAFSYSVSHDLRSPLNTVDGFSRLLAKQLAPQLSGDSGEKVKHYLTRIQAGVAQMGQLIEDLLSLSQVTRAQLRTETVDITLMAHHLMDEWHARQPERQVKIEIEVGLQAQADGRLIRVVMENLLSNAWKFTSQVPQATICVGQKTDAAGLPVFFIKDNGAGFDMAYSDKLFTPFQRLHEASEFSGTGIGLATVSRVIKRHGGRIWAESAPGCGAAFFFTLPQGEAYRAS
ncbi:MAG: domain S-box protein [Polaromonas sp.]|nr:domain S-box protein [Polaromonas sp.]